MCHALAAEMPYFNDRPPITARQASIMMYSLFRNGGSSDQNLEIPRVTSHSVVQLMRECLLRQCAQPATADYALQRSPSSDGGGNTKAKLWLVNFQGFAIYGD